MPNIPPAPNNGTWISSDGMWGTTATTTSVNIPIQQLDWTVVDSWNDWTAGLSAPSEPQPEEQEEEFFPPMEEDEDLEAEPEEVEDNDLPYEPQEAPQPFQSTMTIQEMVNIAVKKPSRNKYDMADKEEFYNKKLSRVVAFKNGRQKGDIGLEIECEGTHLFRTPFKYWSCHEDGSLRPQGDHQPVEYVLKAPLAKADVKTALEYLDQKLKEAKSKIIQSTRTSVHVHVNCQEMTVRELYCYLGLYMILEELLVEWSGPERAGNLFCLRAKDSDFYVKMLESVLKDGNFKGWRDDYRYAACNVASIPKFGSLEFRSMKGTVDVETISTWVDLLWHLKTVASTYDNPIQIVEEFMSIGPLPFFKKIFPDQKTRALFDDIDGISGKLWDGLRLFRDIAYTVDWKKPEKKSPSQNEEQEDLKLYKVGDLYTIPGTEIQEVVRFYTDDTWTVRSETFSPSFSFTIPVGSTMYYVSNEMLHGDYLIVDVREGSPEFAEDN